MPEHPEHQHDDDEEAEGDAPTSEGSKSDSGDDSSVDHQTQFGGVTVDPDQPNDEG